MWQSKVRINNSVTIRLSFLLLSISSIISSKMINILCFLFRLYFYGFFLWISFILFEHLMKIEKNGMIRKNICSCLLSVYNTIRLSRHERICSMRLRFESYFSHHQATWMIVPHLFKKNMRKSIVVLISSSWIYVACVCCCDC